MGGRRAAGAWMLCALPALLGPALTGCHGGLPGAAGEGSGGRRPGATATSAELLPSGYGAVFLAVGECSSSGTVGVTEVPCDSERAAARVVAREDGRARDGPPCPDTTDFVLHISEHRPSGDEDGDGAVPRGYACVRRLRPPHPGDPGGGGGPRTVVGDCVRDIGGGRVREAACDAEGTRGPRFKVVEAVAVRADCPASTALYVRLGGTRPVGCARPL
ncbi:hypothetical protein [Streptomyces sp. OM5714]|uniref:hypothetical protein n=1 Tax=Streptomyces sp. OM5714 TaxID=2602736 RepID=UPI0013D9A193|nr:hypothetical protein [Streptomyces sp. OM5714]KAF2779976.1 membrane protein [Streptomyces sp. OM5714]